jgi:putative resolvase
MTMKLSEWARTQGVTYKTAWLWWKRGRLPVPARQMPSGTILVEVPEGDDAGAVLYARVADEAQAADLDRQVARLAQYAAEHGIRVTKIVKETGGGVGGKRSALLKVLATPEYRTILVERRDRLARFAVPYVEAALQASGRRLVVVDPSEGDEDLPSDLLEALTYGCTRLFGPRAGRRRAERALAVALEASVERR